jgi:hypothetical protein
MSSLYMTAKPAQKIGSPAGQNEASFQITEGWGLGGLRAFRSSNNCKNAIEFRQLGDVRRKRPHLLSKVYRRPLL